MNVKKTAAALMSVLIVTLASCDSAFLKTPPPPLALVEAETVDPRSYLTVANLPAHAQALNVSNVAVWDQTGMIAACESYDLLQIHRSDGSSTLKIPLVYVSGYGFFKETGVFFVSFDLNVDALTRFNVAEEDKIPVRFVNGSGALDVDVLTVSRSYLTIANLPAQTQTLNISNVAVWDQKGKVAECESYDLLQIHRSGTSSILKIPLFYNPGMGNGVFRETGVFYVSFDLSVDALTRYVVTEEDEVQIPVQFVNGSGSLDVNVLNFPRPYLTVANLPAHIQALNVSNVAVWDQKGKVAECESYGLLQIHRSGASASLKILLVYNSSYGAFRETGLFFFRETGAFYVSFDLSIDALTRYNVTEDDGILVLFINGNGELDANTLKDLIYVLE